MLAQESCLKGSLVFNKNKEIEESYNLAKQLKLKGKDSIYRYLIEKWSRKRIEFA
jgi:hypothetical protein